MVEMIQHGVYLLDGKTIVENPEGLPGKDEARENTIAYGILRSHDVSVPSGDNRPEAAGDSRGQRPLKQAKESNLSIRFDAMASHDITYVGII